MSLIAERWQQIQTRVQEASAAAGRDPESVLVLAVSKTFPMEAIGEAYAAGARDFGENYVQEAVEKIDHCPYPDIIWHFIGPLQSNKTRAIATRADWVHTVDRLKIARRLSEQRPPDRPPLNLCLQVNISKDPNKAGVTPEEIPALADQVAAMGNLRLRGLMTIPAQGLSRDELMEQYRQMAALLAALQARHAECDMLSMGMSDDLSEAIACGSTCIRIGRGIFGARET